MYLAHAFLGEGVLVARLRGGQHEEVLELLVLDEGLLSEASPWITLTKS